MATSQEQYDRNKRARDNLEKRLIDHGVSPEKARRQADKTARETDNKRREEGK